MPSRRRARGIFSKDTVSRNCCAGTEWTSNESVLTTSLSSGEWPMSRGTLPQPIYAFIQLRIRGERAAFSSRSVRAREPVWALCPKGRPGGCCTATRSCRRIGWSVRTAISSRNPTSRSRRWSRCSVRPSGWTISFGIRPRQKGDGNSGVMRFRHSVTRRSVPPFPTFTVFWAVAFMFQIWIGNSGRNWYASCAAAFIRTFIKSPVSPLSRWRM